MAIHKFRLTIDVAVEGGDKARAKEMLAAVTVGGLMKYIDELTEEAGLFGTFTFKAHGTPRIQATKEA